MTFEDTSVPILPEWVGGAGKTARYAPPDIGSQATQLNYLQDAMGTGQNPLMLWLAGQMDAGSLQSTYEDDDVVPGDTRGRDFLMNTLNQSPESIEGMIAEHILAGGSPIEAVKLAEQSGLIKPGMKDAYHQGQKVGQEPDTSERDYYMKWATDAQSRLLQDKEEQRTPGKEILHPFVQEMLNAGFTDPRQQYSPEYLDPTLGDRRQSTAVSMEQDKIARAQMEAMQQRANRDPAMVNEARSQMGILSDALRGGMGGKGGPLERSPLPDIHGQPVFNAPQLGGGGFSPNFGLQPQIVAPLPKQGQTRERTPITPYDNTADKKRAKAAEDAYKAQHKRTLKAAQGEASDVGNARGVSRALLKMGRSPAKDQYAAAMQELKNRLGTVNGI
jgi:hypothetical protein